MAEGSDHLGPGGRDRWDPAERTGAYAELDHPADVLLEVWGGDLPALFENALFALYDHLVELERFDAEHEETITVSAPSNSEALRALLAEALYRFETEGFVAIRAKIAVDTGAAGAGAAGEAAAGTDDTAAAEVNTGAGTRVPHTPATHSVRVTARLEGEIVDKSRHTLLTEVKGITYHQLEVKRAPEGGWMANLLFDV
jgi:SHS2 domain-containing protein